MLQSAPLQLGKGITMSLLLSFFLTFSTVGLVASEPSHISRWVHTGFYAHKKSYEDERVVLSLLDDSTFELNHISYFEDDDDVTWEKNMEASGDYQIRGNEIIFTIKVLVGTEDRDAPHYSCPFTLNKKALVLNKCALININNTYTFKRTDPNAFHFY